MINQEKEIKKCPDNMEEYHICHYFTDDHGRTIRVAMRPRGDFIRLHILNKTKDAWIPFDKGVRPRRMPSVEFFCLDEMKELAKNCPLRQT